jgi:hypothetical protein
MSPAVANQHLKIMATKDKLMKLLQNVRSLGETTRRQTVPRNSPLFLLQLRSHLFDANRPRHRLLIATDIEEAANFPQPVKITHLSNNNGV